MMTLFYVLSGFKLVMSPLRYVQNKRAAEPLRAAYNVYDGKPCTSAPSHLNKYFEIKSAVGTNILNQIFGSAGLRVIRA